MLEPILKKNLKLLFIGLNPAPKSCERGIYFSSNRRFWRLLKIAGLTDTELVTGNSVHGDDRTLLRYEFGITDLVHSAGQQFEPALFNAGERQRLEQEIKESNPLTLCFIGKKAYKIYSGTVADKYGWQDAIGKRKVFVMPFPTTTPVTDKLRLVVLSDLKFGLMHPKTGRQTCNCDEPTCGKCLGAGCWDIACKVHPVAAKYRRRFS